MTYELTTNPIPGIEASHNGSRYGAFNRGAQAAVYAPAGTQPVLWLSTRAVFDGPGMTHGGVPVCFPWFGPREGQQIHGDARTTEWELTDTKDTLDIDGRLIVEYRLPHTSTPAYLRLKFTPEYLGIALEVTNLGAQSFTFDAALHTYLAVGDIRQVTLDGLDGCTYLDRALGRNVEERQKGAVEFTEETDRLYYSDGAVTLNDPAWGRKLVITKSGSANTVVWNPWADNAATMEGFGPDEWTGMVCIEAANVWKDAITLLSGQTHTLKQRITWA